jgi:pyruvate formate lyase activating enzyme
LTDRPPTPLASLKEAYRIGKNAGLRYIYSGNCPGDGGEDTQCPGCGKTLIERFGFTTHNNHIRSGNCPDCGQKIDGVEISGKNAGQLA